MSRLPGCLALLTGLLFMSPDPASAVDLRAATGRLKEMILTRRGVGSPGDQRFRLLPLGEAGVDWPARLAERERSQLRRLDRGARAWSGMVGGFPAWGLSAQVTEGPRSFRRIRTRFSMWLVTPGPYLLEVRAESPGGRGRRLAQTRTASLLQGLLALDRGEHGDPFRALRLGPESDHWEERYTLSLGPGRRVQIQGPVPERPERPPSPRKGTLWGYPIEASADSDPAPWWVAEVPGFWLRGEGPPPAGAGADLLLSFLGISEGVDAAAGLPAELGLSLGGP